ncbi:MAG TPA: xanthine dehydrogenase family protein molybdopterin-binding subunit [Caulobacteraceae bacterium]
MNAIVLAKSRSAAGPSRRELVVVSATAAGSLLIGCSPAALLSIGAPSEFGAFGPFVQIAADGTVTVVSKHIEFGQGSHAGLAALVAEELDADWDKVKVVEAPANAKVYANLLMGVQGTGGSSAIANSWEQLRRAGASARAMFVQAAASKWNVPAAQVSVKDGVVGHASGKSASFAELLTAAAEVAPPQNPILKAPANFTLIGTDRVRRKDSPAKSTGTARYTQDVHMPNMLTAMVVHRPRFGATVRSFDASAARKIPGVVDVFQIPSGVAVTAASTWAAKQGRDAVKVVWDESTAEKRGTDAILAHYAALASGQIQPTSAEKWQAFSTKGAGAAPSGGTQLTALYDFPFLAHAPMEPMNCVAEIGGGKARLTSGSQSPTVDQLNTARIVGMLPGSVEVETLFAGGSFGRRTNFQSDYASECVHIAKQVGGGRPVKLVWTREDDMTGGYYRPLVHHDVRVTLGADGYPAHWRHRVVSQSIMKGSPMGGGGLDATAVEGVSGSPYLEATPVVDAQLALSETGVPVLWWRSVGATHTAFVMEHTVDQLAKAAGKDPIDYRRALYARAGANRHAAVFNLAVDKAGSVTPGWARGVAVHESFGSVVAQVVEVKLDGEAPKVGRVITAIDCGTAVSPDQVAAQMEGGTCFGLSAALYGAITMKDGVVEQKNFDTYRVLRMTEAPVVETHILPSTAKPSGVGEPGTPVIAPAVANALLALTGKPTTSLPFVKA